MEGIVNRYVVGSHPRPTSLSLVQRSRQGRDNLLDLLQNCL